MKAQVNIQNFGGAVHVEHGNTVVERQGGDFPIELVGLMDPRIHSVWVNPVNGLRFTTQLADGCLLEFKEHRTGPASSFFAITRRREERSFSEEYLAQDGTWKPNEDRWGPYPEDAVRIPVLEIGIPA